MLLVGMETNVNSSVTSAHGKANADAHLQTAKSAATEVCSSTLKAQGNNGNWDVSEKKEKKNAFNYIIF